MYTGFKKTWQTLKVQSKIPLPQGKSRKSEKKTIFVQLITKASILLRL